jgi:hypothetical protein
MFQTKKISAKVGHRASLELIGIVTTATFEKLSQNIEAIIVPSLASKGRQAALDPRFRMAPLFQN